MDKDSFLASWLRLAWLTYRERMQYVGRTGWATRIIYQRAEVRKVIGHIRRGTA